MSFSLLILQCLPDAWHLGTTQQTLPNARTRAERTRGERPREPGSRGPRTHARSGSRAAFGVGRLRGTEGDRGGRLCKFKSLDFLSCRKPAKPEVKAVGDFAIVLERLLFVVWTASFAPPNALPCQEMNIRTYEAFRCHTARTLNEYLIYKSLWLRLWGTRRDPCSWETDFSWGPLIL